MDNDLVVIGRILKPLGFIGEVLVEPLTFDPDRFKSINRVALQGNSGLLWKEIRYVRKKGNHLVLKLEGFNNPDDTILFKGCYLKIDKALCPVLPEGTYYYYQLEGLSVYDEEGNFLGEISSIMKAGGADVYVIKDPEGGERLIPALREVILSVNLSEKKMIVRLLEMV